ncbi:MAG: zf-HC2 domain-containing protein [Chloroflexi bacterium]|nr:zf-HC2 domain-containing protein [Chloroflexota bacterium]MCI0810134.1 zf-HC2 domain-containing protein [Chloroflexota bacterium]
MFRAIKRYFRQGEFDCEDVADHSSAYIENDLKDAKRSAFQAHLSKCGPCQAFVETLSSTISALGRLPGINAPSALKKSLLDRMQRGS